MKLLVVCSSLDLRTPLSATPAWWQLLKALYEAGVELAVTAYQGTVPETLWWRSYPNPARLEGDAYGAVRNATRRLRGGPPSRESETSASEPVAQKAVRRLAQSVIAPRWRNHLARILKAERGVDAVLLLSVPPNHLRGVAQSIRADFGVPVLFYDGDAPASLPPYSGFASGFGIYHGADLGEFDAVISNSKGAAEALRDLGAKAIHTLYYAADPDIYKPLAIPQDIDILFYGHTTEYRGEWIRAMLAIPSAALPEARFAVRGVELGTPGRVDVIPYLGFNDLRGCIARSRVNLVIARRPHANVFASSTMRPFELAMMAACMVCNPILGIEEWFEPGKELVVVGSAEESIERYRYLLSHDQERRAIGSAARERALAQHTYRHRASQLVQILTEHL
jgi:glycosyltransferase involved in cell wall biosynthesis